MRANVRRARDGLGVKLDPQQVPARHVDNTRLLRALHACLCPCNVQLNAIQNTPQYNARLMSGACVCIIVSVRRRKTFVNDIAGGIKSLQIMPPC